MATKLVFMPGEGEQLFREEFIQYEFFGGFALSQKRKCITSLHASIQKAHPEAKILEISSKSPDELGVELSAFNLKLLPPQPSPIAPPVAGTIAACAMTPVVVPIFPLECVFQSAKKFLSGGPFADILNKSPRDAKRDERLRASGDLQSFEFEGKSWPLEPKSLFYDWIYIRALSQNPNLADELIKYDIFTDIEFNHTKSINCQARSAAIYVKLYKSGQLKDVLAGKIDFASLYKGVSYFTSPMSIKPPSKNTSGIQKKEMDSKEFLAKDGDVTQTDKIN